MEQEQELEREAQVATAVETEAKADFTSGLEDLPRLEDLLKSEKEVKTENKIEGLTAVEPQTSIHDRTFARKEDKKKIMVKRRLKTITAVYGVVVSLLLAFVGINLFTLISLNKDITSNTATMQAQNEVIQVFENNAPTPEAPAGSFEISLNEPRDYADDKEELTMFDKITILFRNLFG